MLQEVPVNQPDASEEFSTQDYSYSKTNTSKARQMLSTSQMQILPSTFKLILYYIMMPTVILKDDVLYEISRPPDGKWGAQTENGSWNGLIGQLERRVRINGEGGTICLIEVQDVDLVAAPLTVQITRENAVDFTLPYYYDSGAILLKKPDPIATKWRTLIDPLSGYASTRPDYIKFWKGVVSYNKTKPSILSAKRDVQVRLVMEGDYAYVGDKTHMELTMVNNCHLTMALSDIVSLQYAIALPNKSPFTKIFSDEMTAIFENRLFQMWKLKHWPKHGICDKIARKESSPITLIDIHSSFYVVAIGVFIASSFLICECFKWKYHNRRLMQDKANQAAHETELVKMKSNVEESM
ncbi:unnamed protein product [Mytilus coruscus]|uniref:Ionotropic glutamate receptor C-terminal domain-containing protein n=1 Tax=Mytilus coruscus TaxID=42192 RepID=A0A6J8EFK1_MYTCO|nr:unnamed protein product [Mytilus coruscus]